MNAKPRAKNAKGAKSRAAGVGAKSKRTRVAKPRADNAELAQLIAESVAAKTPVIVVDMTAAQLDARGNIDLASIAREMRPGKPFVSVGKVAELPELVMTFIERWWIDHGAPIFARTKQIVIIVAGDVGLPHGRWHSSLQGLADQSRVPLVVRHADATTVEGTQRLFSIVSIDLGARRSLRLDTLVSLLGHDVAPMARLDPRAVRWDGPDSARSIHIEGDGAAYRVLPNA